MGSKAKDAKTDDAKGAKSSVDAKFDLYRATAYASLAFAGAIKSREEFEKDSYATELASPELRIQAREYAAVSCHNIHGCCKAEEDAIQFFAAAHYQCTCVLCPSILTVNIEIETLEPDPIFRMKKTRQTWVSIPVLFGAETRSTFRAKVAEVLATWDNTAGELCEMVGQKCRMFAEGDTTLLEKARDMHIRVLPPVVVAAGSGLQV